MRRIARIVMGTYGFTLGINQYIFFVFLYGRFGANEAALRYVVWLLILGAVIVLLTEVPTGILGDHIGRKKATTLCFALAAAASFCRSWIAFVDSMVAVVFLAGLVEVLYSLSYTLWSGSFIAWVVDSVRERAVPEGHGPIIARCYSDMLFAKIIGAMIGVALFLQGYAFYAFGIACTASLLCAIYCSVVMQETHSHAYYTGKLFIRDSVRQMREILVNGLRITISTPRVVYVAVIDISCMMLIHIVLYLWPIAMKANFGIEKMSGYWFLIVLTSFVASFSGAKCLEWLHARYQRMTGAVLPNIHLWKWIVLGCLTTAGAILTIGISCVYGGMTLPLFIAMLAIFNVGYGFLMPAADVLINYYIPVEHSKERATIMSLSAMGVNFLMAILLFPSSGSSGEATAVGWILPASILVIVTLVTHALMRRHYAMPRKVSETVGQEEG